MLEEEKLTKLQKRNQILNKVKDHIDTNLYPEKSKHFGAWKTEFRKPKGNNRYHAGTKYC